MAETTAFELVTPARIMMAVDASMVVVPGSMGLFGAMPRHAPTISTLKRGIVEVYVNNSVNCRIMVDGGIVDVTEDRCTVLAERAVNLDHADRSDLEAQRQTANQNGNAREEEFLDAAISAL
ncbi:MAG: ATP synthase F1 subunit epsilon [Candidatus Puniceispirillales bacterium]|nr:ATP synthase F1 subunit epsilon [Pseudomonadota bacterium]